MLDTPPVHKPREDIEFQTPAGLQSILKKGAIPTSSILIMWSFANLQHVHRADGHASERFCPGCMARFLGCTRSDQRLHAVARNCRHNEIEYADTIIIACSRCSTESWLRRSMNATTRAVGIPPECVPKTKSRLIHNLTPHEANTLIQKTMCAK